MYMLEYCDKFFFTFWLVNVGRKRDWGGSLKISEADCSR